ncbi:helix-turn-helix transcriptional regulator [Streptomyces mirabilis]|uniref:helix-turn-helix domain-containing protein n=1 Tax=Streptomyces mirabilis TaxID=68239 RepID=UPI003330C0CD
MSARVRLAGRLIEGRISAGLTSRQLAEKSGLSASTISRYEDASRVPSVDSLVQLSRAFGHDVGELNVLHEIWRAALREVPSPTDQLSSAWRAADFYGLDRVHTPEDLRRALQRVHTRAGAPSVRSLQQTMGWSKTAVANLLSKPKLPNSDLYEDFLQACSVANLTPWKNKWAQLKEQQDAQQDIEKLGPPR